MAVVLKQKSRQMDSPFRTAYVQLLQFFLFAGQPETTASMTTIMKASAVPYRVRVASHRGLEFEADSEITATQIAGFDDPIDTERTMSIGMARPWPERSCQRQGKQC